jgi:hypothetical protein
MARYERWRCISSSSFIAAERESVAGGGGLAVVVVGDDLAGVGAAPGASGKGAVSAECGGKWARNTASIQKNEFKTQMFNNRL